MTKRAQAWTIRKRAGEPHHPRGPRDHHMTRFQRLPQRVEGLAREFGGLSHFSEYGTVSLGADLR